MNMNVACPKRYSPRPDILNKANEIAEKTGAKMEVLDNPREAAEKAIMYLKVILLQMK